MRDSFFPKLPTYTESIIEKLSTPRILITEKTQFSEVYNNHDWNFSSVGESNVAENSFFCIAKSQPEEPEDDEQEDIRYRLIYAIGHP